MRREKQITGGILLLISLLLVGWFFTSYELTEEEIKTFPSPKAIRNPFLAAEHFLTKAGYQTQSMRRYDWLENIPFEENTVIINKFFQSMTDQQYDDLKYWIEDGGHLILTPDLKWNDQTKSSGYRLLDELGIVFTNEAGDEMPLFELLGLEEFFTHYNSNINTFSYSDSNQKINVLFKPYSKLRFNKLSPSFSIPAGEDDFHLLQFEYGKGFITITSDNWFIRNSHIGKADHAWFLSLLSEINRSQKIWLLYDRDMPSIWQLIITKSLTIVISLGITLLLFLWFISKRHGPILTTENESRRNVLEHLNAMSLFKWKHGKSALAVRPTQRQVLERWIQHNGGLQYLNQQEQINWISEHSVLDTDEVKLALYTATDKPEQVIAQARLIQILSYTRIQR